MYKKYFKRLLDIVISLIALPFFLIILLIVGTIIKLQDNGPIFYKSPRIGKDFKEFDMIKFRSMRVNSPIILNSDGGTYNSENDPRVTRIGKLLRETSLDEVPQIINVLKNDMSIIGPRASLMSALDTYQIDEKDKMLVRPGITGYTQAYFRNNISNREKRLKDSWYSRNINFKLDMKIFIRTIFTVINRKNIYTEEKQGEKLKEERDEKNSFYK